MGYLDAYGAGVDRRNRLILYSVLAAIAVAIVAAILYFKFRDRSEEQQVQTFLERLQAHDYKGAYALWGCTDATPCRDYTFDKFMEDWGPNGPFKDPQQAQVTETHSCKTGVIEVLTPTPDNRIILFVDRNTGTLSFAPWPLRPAPPGFRHQLAEFMWDMRRDCDQLVRSR